jgi:hypothetical protein
MLGQEEQAKQFKNVMEPWPIYDSVLIGPAVDTSKNWYASFATMAQQPEIPFLNVRTLSDAGASYTNITSRDKFPWLYYCESIGIRFLYPDPVVDNASTHTAIMAATALFQKVIPEHAYFELQIREDVIYRACPAHMPAGIGVTGFVNGNNAANNFMMTTLTNGVPAMANRWKFVNGAIAIPRDTPVLARLFFSQYGKDLLTQLGAVSGFDFGGVSAFPNVAKIELTLFGVRGVQQRGEYHYE